MVYSKTSENGFSSVDIGHWLRVKQARNQQGLASAFYRDNRLPDHPLVGRTLVNRKNESFFVEAVTQDWLAGSFLTVLLRDASGSHATRVFSNLSSIVPCVQRQADDFLAEFSALH